MLFIKGSCLDSMFICLIGREMEKVIFLGNENSVLRFLKGYTANNSFENNFAHLWQSRTRFSDGNKALYRILFLQYVMGRFFAGRELVCCLTPPCWEELSALC